MSITSPSKFFIPSTRVLAVNQHVQLYLTSRSLSLDALEKSDPLEEDEDPLAFFLKQGKDAAALEAQLSSSEGIPTPIVAECRAGHPDAAVSWFRGPLKGFERNRTEITANDVAKLVIEHQSVDPSRSFLCFFLRIGTTTFRLLALDERVERSRADSEESQGAAGLGGDHNEVATSPFRRVNRYTQAVAYEFVTNLMDSMVLTPEVE